MSNKRKICVVITARPSYSRIRTALRAIDDHPALELQLVVAASALLARYGTGSVAEAAALAAAGPHSALSVTRLVADDGS
ncbi:MAG: hypothetical protein AAFY48_00160, partial [Bacteroidota bacterium]